MMRNTRFWVLMAVFQVIFGTVVFTVTREYYIDDSGPVSTGSTAMRQPVLAWPGSVTAEQSARSDLVPSTRAMSRDPVEISRQANESFAGRQYARAAELYEQLLILGPDNVETYNNLGITLHYLGRSGEALSRLNEGLAVDPTYQRIWLTLGFVNAQLGNNEQARVALTNATQIDADSDIGRSATEMLQTLP